jgi:hypothetical protein
MVKFMRCPFRGVNGQGQDQSDKQMAGSTPVPPAIPPLFANAFAGKAIPLDGGLFVPVPFRV